MSSQPRDEPAVSAQTSPSAPTLAAVAARRGHLRWFFGLTFALGWGIAAVVLLARPQLATLTGGSGRTTRCPCWWSTSSPALPR